MNAKKFELLVFLVSVFVIAACAKPRLPSQVVAISIRGAADDELDGLIDGAALGSNSAFVKMATNGYRAIFLQPLYNAETSAAMATFETGAYPASHGIVGNVYRRKGGPFSEAVAGFDKSFDSETLWEAAARQGKKVIRVGTFYLNGSQDNHASVRTIAQGVAGGVSKHVSLSSDLVDKWQIGSQAFEHIQPLHAFHASKDSLRIDVVSGNKFSLELYALAVDTLNDRRQGYHAVILDNDRNLQNGFLARLAENQWAPITIKKEGAFKIGAWVKLIALASNLSAVKLYIRGPQMNRGYPGDFIEAVEAAIGFAPGGPDFDSYNTGLIDESIIIEEIKRETQYVIDAANFCLKNFDFDLMTVDYAILDRFGHAFYLMNPRQDDYSVSAHIYINLSGREPNGTVSGSAYQAFVDKIISACENFLDPQTGMAVFDKILPYEELYTVGLDNRETAGDVWVRLRPGYTFKGDIDADQPLIDKPRFAGEHGYSPEAREAKGIFYYIGPTMYRGKPKEVNAVDVAATLSALLGIDPARSTDGKNIFSD
jgi:hypothetical protein